MWRPSRDASAPRSPESPETMRFPRAPMRPVDGSKGKAQMPGLAVFTPKASFEPSADTDRPTSAPGPTVSRSGDPSQSSVCGSTATRHRFLTACERPSKYRNRPVGAHLNAVKSVSDTAEATSAGMVEWRSDVPSSDTVTKCRTDARSRAQIDTRPSGVHAAARIWYPASPGSVSGVGAPPDGLTTYSLMARTESGAAWLNRIASPFGDHCGADPNVVSRRSSPPVAATMKRPPPSRSDRKTSDRPSGDHDGAPSRATDEVSRTARGSSTPWIQIPELPSASEASARRVPSGDHAGSACEPFP